MAQIKIARKQETNMFVKILRMIPLLLLLLIAYNLVILFAGDPTDEVKDPVLAMFTAPLFSLPMLSGGVWTFTLEHLFLAIGLLFLFFELIKATSIGGAAIAEMAISTLVFIVFLVEFLLVKQASTSLFFLLMVITLIDVIAGYVIGIKVARRDLVMGGAGLM
jgi:ABC-type amino acid transport system permease subunit